MENILLRTQHFAGHLLRTVLPRNEHYRPIGIHLSSKALATIPTSGAHYVEVYPSYTSHLAMPDEFVALAPASHAVPPHQTVEPAFVLLLPEGRVNVDDHHSVALITRDNCLVGDVSLQFTPGQHTMAPAVANPIFRQRYFRPPLAVAGTVCSLLAGGAAAAGNYYHWLIDSLPRLHLVAEAGLWDTVDYFLIYSREHCFAVETLLALGIRNEQILDVQQASHICAAQLLVTSPVRGTGRHTPAWVGEFLKAAFHATALAEPNPPRFSSRVYVSRRDAGHRQVLNEAAVEALLGEYGFESYALTELSFREKVVLFAGARAVVGPVGAGLANIVFCAPGTPLIELLPNNFVVPTYLDLTAQLGMPHYPLISPLSAEAGPRTANHHAGLTVDLEALRGALHQALHQPVVA
jgi:hypothetical protein